MTGDVFSKQPDAGSLWDNSPGCGRSRTLGPPPAALRLSSHGPHVQAVAVSLRRACQVRSIFLCRFGALPGHLLAIAAPDPDMLTADVSPCCQDGDNTGVHEQAGRTSGSHCDGQRLACLLTQSGSSAFVGFVQPCAYICGLQERWPFRVQELCESQGGRPGLSVLTSLLVSVDVKLY